MYIYVYLQRNYIKYEIANKWQFEVEALTLEPQAGHLDNHVQYPSIHVATRGPPKMT